MKLTENIKYLRSLRGFTQADIAEKLNKTKGAISNWENGLNFPNPDEVEKLCKIFDVTPNQIFGWDAIPELEQYISAMTEKNERMEQLQSERKRIKEELRQIEEELLRVRR